MADSSDDLNKLKSKYFLATSVTACDFTTSFTTFHHNIIKEKLTEIIEQTFYRVNSLYWACNEKTPLFLF